MCTPIASQLLAVATDPGLFGWRTADLPLLVALPFLLVVSATFSGSETALFGLTAAERLRLREARGFAAHAVDRLLANPRMLLVTILLANTITNVLYFVISSVLLMHSSVGALGEGLLAGGFLLVIVLAGEVMPKVVANATRVRFAITIAPLLLAVHRTLAPVRVVLTNLLIAPLSRLATAEIPPDRLTDRELRQLVDLSQREGLIDPVEQAVLSEVLTIRRLHVHDVMTPRTSMAAVPVSADRAAVRRCAAKSRQTVIPVYRRNLDEIVGVLHVKRMLLDESITAVTDRRVLTAAHFVPDLVRLDQLLDAFRRGHTRVAVVVDEYGGTEGMVTVEDVVEEVVGDIVGGHAPEPPRLIGLGRWRCWGRSPLHEWTEAFELRLDTSMATLAGLIAERLGRPPNPGDVVDLGELRLEVETVEGRQAASIIVAIDTNGHRPDPPAGGVT